MAADRGLAVHQDLIRAATAVAVQIDECDPAMAPIPAFAAGIRVAARADHDFFAVHARIAQSAEEGHGHGAARGRGLNLGDSIEVIR